MRLERVNCRDCWRRIGGHFSGERVTLGAGEEVDEVAGGASGMDVDRIGKVRDRVLGCMGQSCVNDILT